MKENFERFKKDAKKATDRFGTPAYIIYESQLKKNYHRFCAAFDNNWDKIDVSYSVKTNYLPAVVHNLYTLGAKIEIVSAFELIADVPLGSGQAVSSHPDVIVPGSS